MFFLHNKDATMSHQKEIPQRTKKCIPQSNIWLYIGDKDTFVSRDCIFSRFLGADRPILGPNLRKLYVFMEKRFKFWFGEFGIIGYIVNANMSIFQSLFP